MKITLISKYILFFIVCIFAVWSVSGSQSVDYQSAYATAFQEAEEWHREYEDQTMYNAIEYTLCDMDNDGIKELVVGQQVGKRGAFFRVYTTDGVNCHCLGEFEGYSFLNEFSGYNDGFIYSVCYKGGISLYNVRYTGDGFVVDTIYEGSYDREGIPPTLSELSGVYDGNKLYESAPEFISIYDKSTLEKASGTSLSWKSEYQNHLEEIVRENGLYDDGTREVRFSLIYLDDNDIPELVIDSNIHAESAYVFTFYNGKFNSIEITEFGSYIERTGLFAYSDVATGYHTDEVFLLDKGDFYILGSGHHDSYMEEFEWDGEIVSEEEYDARLTDLYNGGMNIYSVNGYSYPEIIRVIDDYTEHETDISELGLDNNIPTSDSDYDGIEFVSWADAGLADHEVLLSDAGADAKIRTILDKWDAPVLLSDLWELTELDLTPVSTDSQIRNIDFVRELRNLTVLNLNYNQITDLSPVSGLTQLEGLFINSNPVSDISPLGSMSWIARLDMSGTEVSDYSPLKGMTGLKTLHLYDNDIGDENLDFVINCVENLQNLEKLNLGCNHFTEYSPLSRMTQIKTLSMWNSELDNTRLQMLVNAISSLPKLKTLSVSNNNISDVSCLTTLKKLEKLIINNNPVADFSVLRGTKVKSIESENYDESLDAVYDFPSGEGQDTAAELEELAAQLEMEKVENTVYPDGYYEGNGIKMGSNYYAEYDTPCQYVENRGNQSLRIYGIQIGMTYDEVMEKARSLSSRAELKDSGYLYLGREGSDLKVEFDDDGKLAMYEMSMYYTG